MKIAYLLGSGVSIYGGMPATSEITQRILSGKNISREIEVYGISNVEVKDEHVKRVVNFLQMLKSICDLYYVDLPDRSTNYEDLYYLAHGIFDSEIMKDNPVFQPLIQNIRTSIELKELADEAINYIRDVVSALLSIVVEGKKTKYLEKLMVPCLDETRLQNVDIFTLNHDTLVEQFLEMKNLEYVDGFEKNADIIRYMDMRLFDAHEARIRLLKLHGSINWYRFDANNILGYNYGIPRDKDIWHQLDRKNHLRQPIDGRPQFLVGTINKFYDYSAELYAQLHRLFLDYLQEVTDLIICGYGFNDRVINRYIVQWQVRSSDRRITIVHRDPEGLRKRLRGSIVGILNGRTSFVRKWAENVNTEEIVAALSR